MQVDQLTRLPTDALKVLGESRRWDIIELLAREELCVCHLVEELGLAQPLVSHHLRVLREAGLVESEKHRQWTYYRLQTDVVASLGARLGTIADRCPAPGERRRPCG